MKNKTESLIFIGASIALGAFISFLFTLRIEHTASALAIGFFYALSFSAILLIVRKYVLQKMTILSTAQQWFIRSAIYTISISFAYLLGLLFQTILLTPVDQIYQFFTDKIWQVLIELISAPVDLQMSRFFPESQQIIIMILFSVILFIALLSVIGSYVEVRWRENKSRLMRESAELRSLRAQIEPHFLFNSLNTIAALIKVDQDKAEDLIIQLSEILQFLSHHAKKDCIKIREEVIFTKKYITLLQARFGEKIKVNWHEDFQNDDFHIPVLIMQPIIENCIRHAWPEDKDQLSMHISVIQKQQTIRVIIEDDGRGMHPQKLKKIPIPGHALANITDRLNMLYHQQNLLSITSVSGIGTKVFIEIPENCIDHSNPDRR